MKLLADGLYQLKGFPPNAINVYLMGDVIVDAASRYAKRRILRQVEGRPVSAHALTHAHPDHQGASHAICEKLDIPLWCGAADIEVMENGLPSADNALANMSRKMFEGPPHPVSRALAEGDEVGGFTVLESPGHSPGHVAYWRESDRALIIGDVVFGIDPRTGAPGLHEPPKAFTPDPAQNRESARRLAQLEPALVCFGHGPPFRDAARFRDWVEALPR